MSGHGGPLAGLKVVEIAGLGPVPYCGMLLSDMGADVVMVERPDPGATGSAPRGALERGRRYLTLDAKRPECLDILLRLIERSDALIEGFRPGVAERLGFGPDVCLARNPRLVYGRVTGWGREGPLAQAAGHDLNYIALSGLLHAIGTPGGKPVVPLNVIGDFGGGGLLLAFGLVCALLSARQTGRGQVVDAAMLDGAASFMAPFTQRDRSWGFDERPGRSLLAGAAPYYDTYETRDGGYVSVAAIEPAFHRLLVEKLGLDPARFARAAFPAYDAATRDEVWPQLKQELAALFRTRTRAEWSTLLEGSDACFAPVLPLSEAVAHPHNLARRTFVDVGGELQPAPAPRFGSTPPATPTAARPRGADTRAVLEELGLDAAEIDRLQASGALGRAADQA
jgi:alpha-methylacyl-CoA racemase